MNVRKVVQLAPMILKSDMVKWFFAFLGSLGFIGLLFLFASNNPRSIAQGATREEQIEKLRNEQIALEQNLVKIQADWQQKELLKIEAEKVFQERLSELNSVTAAGNEIRTKIDTISKQAENIRDSASGFTKEVQ